MGEIRLYQCSSCGYEKQLFVGMGMGGKIPLVVQTCIPEDIYSAFQAEQDASNIDDYNLDHRIISCPDCKNVYTVPHFNYRKLNGEEVSYLAPCPDCGSPGTEQPDNENVPCPKCGKILSYTPTGFWD